MQPIFGLELNIPLARYIRLYSFIFRSGYFIVAKRDLAQAIFQKAEFSCPAVCTGCADMEIAQFRVDPLTPILR